MKPKRDPKPEREAVAVMNPTTSEDIALPAAQDPSLAATEDTSLTTPDIETQARELSAHFHSLQKLGLITLMLGAALVLSASPLIQIVGAFSGAAGVVLTVLAFRTFRQMGKLQAPMSSSKP